ncbi:MAG TPA: Rne/Rng family ribonuclease [Steroidobacteraceae bacterium]|nr:Rne/Rng family ribonuclease [Steroidobacteraceae bacterium]
MKRMLVNATQQEELRVAMVDGQKLYDLSIDIPSREQKKANIYKGRISRVEQSLEACFVDYGAERHGFLPLKEISKDYFKPAAQGGGRSSNIRDLVSEGQEVIVQVEKEERGNKGAALTTFISLAGRFLVLMPNNPRAGGVSRRIEGEERDLARQAMDELVIPEGMGAIIRTAGVGRQPAELQWDLDNLKAQWDEVDAATKDRPAPYLVYRESDAVTRALRDYLSDDIGEILVDDDAAYATAQEYMTRFMPPEAQRRLKKYTDDIALFNRYQIESQIESAYAHKVQLPSGGSIVIDYTEALVSIDINSARATRGADIEATALNTNLEAADEIARQLRIRDLGGLIVIDFIDMESQKNQREVEDRLRDAVHTDRARIQIGRLSRFGLLEMSRQRLRPSLDESSHIVCPRCTGIGSIRSVESMALAILRLIGEEARKDRTAKIIAQVPVEVATYLINEKREWLRTLEDKSEVEMIIVPNPHIQTPEYSIKRVRLDELDLAEHKLLSYKMPEAPQVADPRGTRANVPQQEPAAVQPIPPVMPAPIVVHVPTPAAPAAAAAAMSVDQPRPGVLTRLKTWFLGTPAPVANSPIAAADPNDAGGAARRQRGDRGRDARSRHERGGRRDGSSRSGGRDRKREPARDGGRDRPRGEARDAQASQSGQRDSSRGSSRGGGDRQREPRRDRQEPGRQEQERVARSEIAAGAGAVGAAEGARAEGDQTEGNARPERSGRPRRRGRRGRGGSGGNREGGLQSGGGSEGSNAARAATPEEREVHARASSASETTPREPQRDADRSEPRDAPRESATRDALPPPPAPKPHVVWSSSPADNAPRNTGADD